jgi:negative regulator of flagellin synthesis FlgM
MAIEINNLTTTPSQVTEAGGQPRTTPQPAADKATDRSATQNQSTDQVSLTPTAQQLRGLEQQIADQPVVDTQKVNAVKEALASGSFEIDPSRVAGKMMSLEKALGDMS